MGCIDGLSQRRHPYSTACTSKKVLGMATSVRTKILTDVWAVLLQNCEPDWQATFFRFVDKRLKMKFVK